MDDNEDLDSYTHRLRQESMYHIKDGLEYVTIIFGSTIVKYEEDKIIDKLTLDSKLIVSHDRYAETSILLNEILNKENIQ